MCDRLQADSVLKSVPLLLYWALSYHGQRQNVGAGDPPSTFPIDGVPTKRYTLHVRVLMFKTFEMMHGSWLLHSV